MSLRQEHRERLLQIILAVIVTAIIVAGFLRNFGSEDAQEANGASTSVQKIEQAAAAQPDRPDLQRTLAEIQLGAGRVADARITLQKLCRLTPGDVQSWLLLGNIELELGSSGAALRAYRRAAELEPDAIPVLCAFARLDLHRGRLQQARTRIERALKLDPRWGCPHLIKGLILQRTAMVDAALPHFQNAVSREPGNAAAWLTLARAMFRGRRLAETETACNRVLYLDAANVQALTLLAETKLLYQPSAQRMQEAVALCEKALQVQPQHSGAHYVLGVVELRQGRAAQAIPHLEAAVNSDPSRVDARANLVKAYQRAGRAEAAALQLKLLRNAVEYEKKVQALVARSQARPDDPLLHFRLGKLYASVGAREKAAGEFRATLELRPAHREAQAELRKLQ